MFAAQPGSFNELSNNLIQKDGEYTYYGRELCRTVGIGGVIVGVLVTQHPGADTNRSPGACDGHLTYVSENEPISHIKRNSKRVIAMSRGGFDSWVP